MSRFSLVAAVLLGCGALWGCGTSSRVAAKPTATLAPRLDFSQDDKQLDEVSGVAVVRSKPGLLWMHNDSGDTARLFAVNRSGKIALTVNLQGANAFDWEDCDAQGKWIYAGDIGDNLSIRQNVQIYRFHEPKKWSGELTLGRNSWQQTTLKFPDGAHNCESLAVAPDGRILLVTKEESGISGFYIWDKSWKDKRSATLSKMASFKFDGPGPYGKLATGADFSPDGRKLIVTTYTDLYEFRLGRSFDFASLELRPVKQELPAQKQCEAVCYSLDGKTIYSTGEGKRAALWVLGSKLN